MVVPVWVFLIEITCDTGLGIAVMIMYGLLMLQTTTMHPMIESLTLSGFFVMSASLTLIALLYTIFAVAETKGLKEE